MYISYYCLLYHIKNCIIANGIIALEVKKNTFEKIDLKFILKKTF